MVFLKYIFNRFRHENILSGSAVDAGNIQNIFNNLYTLENKSLYSLLYKIIVLSPILGG